ncbi:hypothetical protein D3C81_1622770 [compost metagenome]
MPWYGLQCRIDQRQQAQVLRHDSEREVAGFERRVLNQLHVVELAFAGQVMGPKGIAQVKVGLAEGHGAQGIQCRCIGQQLGMGVQLAQGCR